MKKATLALTASMLMCSSLFSQMIKFHKEPRDIRKEARKLEKAGWQNYPGSKPIIKQVADVAEKLDAVDEQGQNKFITKQTIASGYTLMAAEMMAYEYSKTIIASMIESHIRTVVKNDHANSIYSDQSGASLDKAISVSITKISRKMGLTVPVMTLIRHIKGRYEVLVVIAYNHANMLLEVKQQLLEEETKMLHEENSEFLNKKKGAEEGKKSNQKIGQKKEQ